MKKLHSKGFTIIELMVATVVFSVILLVLTNGIIQMGRTYSRGLTESKTNDITRTALDDISQAIQFSGGTITGVSPAALLTSPDGSTRGFCINGRMYSFRQGVKVTAGAHGLVASNPGTCAGQQPQNLPTVAAGSQELLGENMRVANLTVAQSATNPQLYTISLRVVNGDDDLLCDLTPAPGNCSASATMTSLAIIAAAEDLSCKNLRAGAQFCAVSELNTTVERRL